MFKNNQSFNNSFFGGFSYDSIINRHQDHLLVKINSVVCFDGFNELVKDCYDNSGRYAYQPVMIFKILLIQFLYDLSDREVMERIDTDIISRYFVGLSLVDSLPHFTRLNTFKDRLGQTRFEELFNCIVKSCREASIISDELRIIDTTDQKANVNLVKLKKLFKKDDNDDTYVDRNSKDQDAGFGRKSNKGKRWYGYKSATLVDPDTQIITSTITTAANKHDSEMVKPLVEKEINNIGSEIEDLGGDKGFLGKETREVLQEHSINDYIIPHSNSKNHIEGKDSVGFYIAKWKRPAVERVYADTKRKQGLSHCRYIGLIKTSIQNLLTYLTHNLKRIVKAVNKIPKPPGKIVQLCPFLPN
jgi:IS5 family transposase